MSDLGKSVFYGGIYSKEQNQETSQKFQKLNYRFTEIKDRLSRINTQLLVIWGKAKEIVKISQKHFKSHVLEKQELYLPVLIGAILLGLVFVSKTAFSKTLDESNNLPIKDNYKVNLIGTSTDSGKDKVCSADNLAYQEDLKKAASKKPSDELKTSVAAIVKNTPMAAMIDPIAEKSRTVAAFIVGIAMKESKFGVYSPKKGGHDCYNYWGFKGGGSTVAGGYTCFASPDDAVDAVGKRIEKMIAKGVRTPAQAISWKCGSSCAGHDPGGVSKWISDVGINFYKIQKS
ncbi:MAG: hypothetical protein WC858_05285 [Parcubacteria group bacterium]|jgi:hypothetical protein